jgi:hypothetical protein
VWAVSIVAAAGYLLGALVLFALFPGARAVGVTEALSISLTLLVYALPGLVIGSLLGTFFARSIGSRRAWLGGCLGGFILGMLAIALLASDLTLRGITFS